MAGAWTSFIRAKRMLEVLGMKCPQLILKLKWVRSKTCTRGPEGPRARRARTQNFHFWACQGQTKIEKISIFWATRSQKWPKKPKFRKSRFLGHLRPPPHQKRPNFENFEFLLTRQSTRPQKSEISKISMDRTPPHDQGAHPWKKKAPAQLPIHLLPPPPHCPHSVHWWLSCHFSSVLSVLC